MKRKIEKNNLFIMITACLMYTYIGMTALAQGTLKIEIANNLGITTSTLQYMFTYFSISSMVTIVLNKSLLEKVFLKKELIGSSIMSVIGTFFITTTGNLVLFRLGLILNGIGVGIYISLGSYIVINSFKRDRNSKLNFLHSSYSVSAVVTPLLAILLLKISLTWNLVYGLLLLSVVTVLVMGTKIDFTMINGKKEREEGKELEKVETKWDIFSKSATLLLFIYVFVEMNFTYWIVEYLIKNGATSSGAKLGLSIFWLFIASGRLLTGKFGHKIKVINLIIILLSLSSLSYILVVVTHSIFLMYILVGCLGIGLSSLYPSIIALGTEKQEHVSPTLMTVIIMSGSLGGIAYSPVSGFVSGFYGIQVTMAIGAIGVLIMLGTVLILKRKG